MSMGMTTCCLLHYILDTLVFFPFSIGELRDSQTRRLITLISVGWVPPYLHPSGACLNLGTRVPLAHNAAEGYTKPGLRLFR